MSGVDTGFSILFLMILFTLAITNFLQARTGDKTPYQNYFGLIYLVALITLLFIIWNSMR